MHRVLGAIVGVGLGYLAAMGIAALLTVDTGLSTQNLSALLAITCCSVGAVIGFRTADRSGRQSRSPSAPG